jgi:hypothetical protein
MDEAKQRDIASQGGRTVGADGLNLTAPCAGQAAFGESTLAPLSDKSADSYCNPREVDDDTESCDDSLRRSLQLESSSIINCDDLTTRANHEYRDPRFGFPQCQVKSARHGKCSTLEDWLNSRLARTHDEFFEDPYRKLRNCVHAWHYRMFFIQKGGDTTATTDRNRTLTSDFHYPLQHYDYRYGRPEISDRTLQDDDYDALIEALCRLMMPAICEC